MPTRKQKKTKGVLKVDSPSKISALENILKNGKITVVLVFADWCGHCKTFQKDIWNPMCNRPAIHNRVAVRDDMVSKTSLANANFKYLPSVMIVNEKGKLETFTNAEGESTNAMPTPKSLKDMEEVVNVPVTPLPEAEAEPMSPSEPFEPEPLTSSDPFLSPTPTGIKTPTGITYTPSPTVAPVAAAGVLKGGALFSNLQEVSQGILPFALLGGLRTAFRGGSRKTKKRSKKTRRLRRRMIKA